MADTTTSNRSFDYAAFIDEVEMLIDRGNVILNTVKYHDTIAFRTWKFELTQLLELIGKRGYEVKCQVENRLFFATWGDADASVYVFEQQMGDTLGELVFLVKNYKRYGDPNEVPSLPPSSVTNFNNENEALKAQLHEKESAIDAAVSRIAALSQEIERTKQLSEELSAVKWQLLGKESAISEANNEIATLSHKLKEARYQLSVMFPAVVTQGSTAITVVPLSVPEKATIPWIIKNVHFPQLITTGIAIFGAGFAFGSWAPMAAWVARLLA
jgi:hypothetical protein